MRPVRIGIEIHDTSPPRPLGRAHLHVLDPDRISADGIAGMRTSFSPATIVEACRQGIVPARHPGGHGPWSWPDPRAVIVPRNLHVSRRLARTIRRGRFYVSLDAAFELVLAACAGCEQGAWITPEYRRAYTRLHTLGWAHSFEVWTVGGELAGGLYGLNVGGLFAVESMFHVVSDASKIAMVAMAQHCRDAGVTLVDLQLMTPHLASMGAVATPRDEYLEWVRAVSGRQVTFAGRRGEPEPTPYEGWPLLNTSL